MRFNVRGTSLPANSILSGPLERGRGGQTGGRTRPFPLQAVERDSCGQAGAPGHKKPRRGGRRHSPLKSGARSASVLDLKFASASAATDQTVGAGPAPLL